VNLPPVITPEPAPAATPPPPGVRRWRWWCHLLLIAAYPLAIGLLGLGQEADRGPALTGNPRGLLLVCAEQLAIFGAVFGLAWLASRATRDDLLWRWRGGWWPLPLGLAYSIALRLLVALCVAVVVALLLLTRAVTMDSLQAFVLANRPDVESVVDVGAMRRDPVYYWLTLTVVSFVVAGLREELWRAATLAGLRALWPRAFGSRFGAFAAVAVAAVIFGVGHLGQGGLAVVMTGLLGFGLGAIMVWHRSIWPAVIAHGMFDATSLALIPWVLEKLQEAQRATGH
jgi:membrane protease YdiL (CAAX protease family)